MTKSTVMLLLASQYRELTVLYSQDLRTQLTQERESVRRITLQRELDLKELQNKLDKAVRWFIPQPERRG